jgi:hypothetical protein
VVLAGAFSTGAQVELVGRTKHSYVYRMLNHAFTRILLIGLALAALGAPVDLTVRFRQFKLPNVLTVILSPARACFVCLRPENSKLALRKPRLQRHHVTVHIDKAPANPHRSPGSDRGESLNRSPKPIQNA